MTSENGNAKKALSFLRHFRNGVHNLVAIDPATSYVTGITRPIDSPDLLHFIEKNIDKKNLYYSVNEPRPDAPDAKLKKEHIAKINAVWLDADPRKDLPFERERERLSKFAADLKTGPNPPTYITDSGGGIQAFWLFEQPMPATPENVTKAESLSRGLAEQYDTDFVQNIDRIMRVPFTTNIPTAKKKGRQRAQAKIIHAASPQGVRYKDLPWIVPSLKAEPSNEYTQTTVDMEAIKHPLPPALDERLRDTLSRDQRANDLWEGKIDKPSRSEYDFTLTQQLVWDNYDIQDIAHILRHFPMGKGADLTQREIVRMYNRVDRPFNDLDPGYIAQIEAQINPIMQARAQGKPLPDDLKKQGFTFVPLHEMDWKYSGQPIYKDLLYEKAITVIYGQSNVGKSFVAADIAGHVALGRNWGTFKYKPSRPIGVAYICAEAGKSFGKRGKALRKRLGVDRLPFYVLDAAPNFARTKEDTEKVTRAIQELERSTGVKIGLIVVDTLATTFEGGNENSSEDMGLYISNMKYLQRYVDTGVLIVHHSGKDQAAGARGHSSLRAATDTEIEVLSEKKGDRYHRVIRTRKQREGESDLTIKFGLMVVELGQDQDGETITTCHVVLENDTEFESIVPAEVLEPGEQAVMDADKIYATTKNMDKIRANCRMTEIQIKALVYRDIKERIGILVKNDGSLNVAELGFMEKPSRLDSFLKSYNRDREKLNEKSSMSGFDTVTP